MTVKVYTTSTCHWCTKVKEFLKKNNIEFKDINVAENVEAAQEMVHKSGQMGVPVIEVGKEILVGFNEPKLKEVLNLK